MSPRKALALIFGFLILTSLACQTGEVITPEEATARAVEARSVQVRITPRSTPAEGAEPTGPQPGDIVELQGKGFMVNLYAEPGAVRFQAQQERGTQVEVLQASEYEGELWYLIDAPTGKGWVQAEFVKPIAKETPAGQEGGAATAEGPQPGDKVYLTARSYMINLVQEPGAIRFIAQQERDTEVEILDVTEHEGELWYLIDAPTGIGWVKGENITTEKPQ